MTYFRDYCFERCFCNYNGQGKITGTVWKYLLQIPLLSALGFHAIQVEYVKSLKSSEIQPNNIKTPYEKFGMFSR